MSLIAEIVDGENNREVLDQGIGGVRRTQENRDESGLPVMAMDNVSGPDVLGNFNGGATEFAVALGVVGKIAGAIAVDAVAVEIAGIIDKKIAHTVENGAIGNGGKAQAATHGNGEAGHHHGSGFYSAIAGQNDGDFVTLRGQGFGQGLDYVGEAASLGEGKAFGGGEEYSQDSVTGNAVRTERVFGTAPFYAIRVAGMRSKSDTAVGRLPH